MNNSGIKAIVIALIVMAGNGLLSCQQPAPAGSVARPETPLTLFVVRHAEKGLEGSDPDLTPQGMLRAENIARMLGHLQLDAVYSSNYKRTIQTGTPAAMAFGLEIKLYDPHKQDSLAGEIAQKYPGGNVLIVGHSNTAPALLQLLDPAHTYPQMADDEYDNFYVVTIWGKTVKVLQLKMPE